MPALIPKCLLLFLLVQCLTAYAFQLNMSGSAASISDFKTDISSCECNLASFCDNFCCCDSSCDATVIKTWTNNGWCRTSGAQIQNYCSDLSEKGLSSFEDLGCIVYSNRGSIGNFYSLPDVKTLVYPAAHKFAEANTNAPEISSHTTTPTKYGANSAIQITLNGISKSFELWKPSMGSSCGKGYATVLDESSSYQCEYSVQSEADCLDVNSIYQGSFVFCKNANCSQTTSIGSQTAASYDSATGICSGAIIDVQISYQIAYVNGQYLLNSPSVTLTPGDITGRGVIQTTITVTNSNTKLEGNPGYIIGQSSLVWDTTSINQIADSSGNCLQAAGSSQMELKFAVNQTYTCVVANDPCSASYYVDTLASQTLRLSKYATGSESIGIDGINENTCSKQTVTLNILYSRSGWVIDPQYYIVGSIFTSASGPDVLWERKSFQVKWLQIAPDQVSTPPTNNFYYYFNKLWTPLKSKYSQYLSEKSYLASTAGILLLIVLAS